MENSLSIVVPARDEEQHLEGAVQAMLEVAERHFDDFEILIFDDGSRDGTGALADALASEHPRVFALHHERPQGIGRVLRGGFARARMRYAIWLDGKGSVPRESLDHIFSQAGKADLVIPYPVNQWERKRSRRAVSRLFVALVNALFGLQLRYYTHHVLCETRLARRFAGRSDSYACQAEMIVKALKAGHGYLELEVQDCYAQENAPERRSHAFEPRNVLGVGLFFARTLWEVHLRRGAPREPAS